MKRVIFILFAIIAASALTLGIFAADAPTAADTTGKTESGTTVPAPSGDTKTDAPAESYESATRPVSKALAIIAKDFGMAKAKHRARRSRRGRRREFR